MKLYRYWKYWFRSQPWSYKWFLWLTLLMPFFAAFWDLKETAGISPLQIAGFLSILLSSVFIISIKTRISNQGFVMAFGIFALLFLANQLSVFLQEITFNSFGFFLRNIAPFFLFVYLIKVIKTQKQFEGFLITFLFSSVFPLAILYYETFFQPIKYVYIQESRGGGVRLTGFYADLFNYMSFVIGDFVILSYFHIKTILKKPTLLRVSRFRFLIIYIMTIVALLGLKHQASWVVFGTISVLLVLYLAAVKQGRIFLVIFIPFFLIMSIYLINTTLVKLFYKDIAVAEGRIEEERALNGRIARWERYFDYWNKETILTKAFGVGNSGIPYPVKKNMVSGGMHSDYIRFLFSSGFVGLLAYLFSLFSIWKNKKTFSSEHRFIINSGLIIFLLYSVTANPFIASATLMYLVLVTFSAALKPVKTFYS